MWDLLSERPVRRVWEGLLALAAIFAGGVAGYMLLCGWSLADSVYMLVITVSTVGFGEVREPSAASRWITVGVILAGITAATYTFGGLVQALADGQFRRMLSRRAQARRMAEYSDHHVVCGFGRMGRMICEALQRRGEDFVLIEIDPDKVEAADGLGFLVVRGDATDDDVLDAAGIGRAKSLACVLPSDADNVFVTLTGRSLNADLLIAARAERPETQAKLRQAGADEVVAPQVIGARTLTNLLLRPTAAEVMQLVNASPDVDLEMDELKIQDGAPLHEQTLAEAAVRHRTGVHVTAIKHADGSVTPNPGADEAMHAGDTLVVLGKQAMIQKLINECATAATK